MEGDHFIGCAVCIDCISIHSLRMEGDSDLFGDDLEEEEFQSTPSAWRETQYCILSPHSVINFNPLPPHGGRLATPSAIRYCSKFQSTPSAWRETTRFRRRVSDGWISIHSLRMEGDPACNPLRTVQETFQSTPSAWRETDVPFPRIR